MLPSLRHRSLGVLASNPLMSAIRLFAATLVSGVVASVVLVFDRILFFEATSYWLAILPCWVVAGLVAKLYLKRGPSRLGEVLVVLVVLALGMLPIVLPHMNDVHHKAFYRAYERLRPGMSLAAAQAILEPYESHQRGDVVHYRFSPNPATVEYIALRLEAGKVAGIDYLWD